MSEWSNVLVSKTGIPQGIKGSNPFLSANEEKEKSFIDFSFTLLIIELYYLKLDKSST